jgi:hypothetical protein
MARKRNQNANGDSSASRDIDIRQETDAVVARIPVKFYRRNGRQMVLAHNDASGNQQSAPSQNRTLIAILAKAYQWQEELESGQSANLEDLAHSKAVDRSYAGRLIRLTSLAPNVVEQVLAGVEHGTWSLRQLRRGIPLAWEEQGEW